MPLLPLRADARFRLLAWWARHGPFAWSRQSAFRKISRYYDGLQGRSSPRAGLCFDYRIGDPVDTSIAVLGRFEPALSGLIAGLAREHRHFVDVGCNIGYFTCVFAGQRPDAQVLAIDANPEMAQRCRSNAGMNGLLAAPRRIQVVNAGVGKEPGQLRLGMEKNRPSQASFGKGADPACETLLVAVDTLSHLLSAHGMDAPEVLKVDIEGFEPACFQGLDERHSATLRHIFFEYAPEHLARAGFSSEDIWSLPIWRRYRLRIVAERAVVPADLATLRRLSAAGAMIWAERT